MACGLTHAKLSQYPARGYLTGVVFYVTIAYTSGPRNSESRI